MNDDRRALGSAHVEAPMNRLESQQGAAAISRRDMLRRSAVLGGALVVAAPAVQSFARPAFASTPDLADLSSVYIVYKCADGTTYGLKWTNGTWSGVSGDDGLFTSGQCDDDGLALYPPDEPGDPDCVDSGPSGPEFNGSNGPVWSVTLDADCAGCGDGDEDIITSAEGVAKYGPNCDKDALTIFINGARAQSLDEDLQTLGVEEDELDGALEDAAAATALVVLPNLVGNPQAEAEEDLKRLCEPEPCLRVVVEYRDAAADRDGLVIEQEPVARTEVERGSEVRLFVGRAPAEEPPSSTENSAQKETTSSSDSGGQAQGQDTSDPEPETKPDEGDE